MLSRFRHVVGELHAEKLIRVGAESLFDAQGPFPASVRPCGAEDRIALRGALAESPPPSTRSGAGKTHLDGAIGYRAIQNGFETSCTTAAELSRTHRRAFLC